MPKTLPFSDDVLYLNPGLAKQAKTARADGPISTEMPRPSAGDAQPPNTLTPDQTAVARRLGFSLATLHEIVFGAAASQFTDDDLIRAVSLLVAAVPGEVLQRIQAGEWTFNVLKTGD